MKEFATTEAKKRFGGILEAAHREPAEISKKGRTVAVLLSLEAETDQTIPPPWNSSVSIPFFGSRGCPAISCAISGNADVIVANDKSGFERSPIRVVTPDEVIRVQAGNGF